MSFDIVLALTPFADQAKTGEEMYRIFKAVRGDGWRDLPLEFSTDDLFELAQQKGLIKVLEDGRLAVSLKQHAETVKRIHLRAIVKDQAVALLRREAQLKTQPVWQGDNEDVIHDEFIRLANVLIKEG